MWVLRAKQLWLTTPLAMKSPVPVVMSHSGNSNPRSSMLTTRRAAWHLSAVPSIDRLRVIAGSVRWKNRSLSGRPPVSRIWRTRFGSPGSSSTAREAEMVAGRPSAWSRMSSSLLLIRKMPLLQLPSASKMPARKPSRQSSVGSSGQRIRLGDRLDVALL